MADKAAEPAAAGAILKAEASRRVKLQNDYAQAVLWSKGYAADETKAAFERTSALAARAELPAEGFSALYGQYLWSWSRGEFRAARDIAETFSSRGGSRRTNCGGSSGARNPWPRLHATWGTCARREPSSNWGSVVSRSPAAGKGSALTAGSSARAFLALTMWLSGDLPRARELIEEATRLAGELGHPPTTAAVLIYKIAIETARNDFETVRRRCRRIS